MKTGARAGLIALVALAALAIAGPHFAPDPNAQGDLINGALLPPTAAHWLGTDDVARDIFARIANGARISLAIAALAVAVASLLGIAIGLAASTRNRIIRALAHRTINLGLALPRIIVLMVLIAATDQVPTVALGVLVGLTGWPAIGRLVRGEGLRLQQTAFVTASEALGASPGRILWRDIFPGTVPAVLVAASLSVADAILLEAGLSFIGIGVRPPAPSWGNMIYAARDHLADAPWLLIAPCLALVIATSAATLLGESLRRSLHPESR